MKNTKIAQTKKFEFITYYCKRFWNTCKSFFNTCKNFWNTHKNSILSKVFYTSSWIYHFGTLGILYVVGHWLFAFANTETETLGEEVMFGLGFTFMFIEILSMPVVLRFLFRKSVQYKQQDDTTVNG